MTPEDGRSVSMGFAALAVVIGLLVGGCGGGGRPDAGVTTPREPAAGWDEATRIVVDRSIGPVRTGMSKGELRAALGEPDKAAPSELHGGWERWTYRDRRLTLTLTERGEVWDVRTRSGRYRSGRGLRLGLRERHVRERLEGATCQAYGGPRRYRRWRVCNSRAGELGRPFTQVLLIRRVAREIRILQGLAL